MLGQVKSRLPTRAPNFKYIKEKYADKVEFVGVAMISQKEPIENGKEILKRAFSIPSTITLTLIQASKNITRLQKSQP